MTTAQTLRRLRESSGRTVTELAQASGISRQALQMIESGQRQPTLETAQKIVTALGKSLAELDADMVQSDHARQRQVRH